MPSSLQPAKVTGVKEMAVDSKSLVLRQCGICEGKADGAGAEPALALAEETTCTILGEELSELFEISMFPLEWRMPSWQVVEVQLGIHEKTLAMDTHTNLSEDKVLRRDATGNAIGCEPITKTW
ncbi:unnamed protein product [Cladocopium goreaui]|uniref:Uncharacterized protein n=1 Tax=Cladocopium goreaui TaxID=2562237 RepID=A0A9P1FPY6_9DINO|nr:unnamed protein product [Cladocopium goreaui]